MTLFESIPTIRSQIQQWRQAGQRIALVPTMGNLHAGHLSLVEIAQQHADKVVVSIFVNPTQFGPDEDFDRYPRTFEADSYALEQLSVDALFFPTVTEMYPLEGREAKVVAPEALTTIYEGASRPGHFDGVTTVVTKLFQIIQPDIAVFGQKDFQQFAVIQTMVDSLFMPIELVRAPIVRDTDGLALSSRNQYLTQQQRQIAPSLSNTLEWLEGELESGNTACKALCQLGRQMLLEKGFDAVDYIDICDANSLVSLASLTPNQSVVIMAVARLGKTRLLDNRLYTHIAEGENEG